MGMENYCHKRLYVVAHQNCLLWFHIFLFLFFVLIQLLKQWGELNSACWVTELASR